MIRSLLCIYIVTHFTAFMALRRVFFPAFRYYALAAAAQATVSLWPWNREVWWATCWIYVEPFMLVWRLVAFVELGYYATTRLYTEERWQLFKVIAYSSGIFSLIAFGGIWRRALFAREIAVLTAFEVTLAAAALTGCWYFWRRPAGASRVVKRHGCLLTLMLTFKAMVDLTWPMIRDDSAVYWIINGCYLGAISILMLTWAALAMNQRRAAYA